MVCAMEWLQEHGFLQKEPVLEDFLSRAPSDGLDAPTLVFSRQLREDEALLPERHLVGINFRDKVRRPHYRWVNHGEQDEAGAVPRP